VLGADLTGCSDRALKAFFAGATVQTTCNRRGGRIPPDGPIPSRIAAVRPAAAPGLRGRTVSAATLTVFDVLEQSADALLTDPLELIHGGGLRGGRYFETGNSIVLRRVVYIPGVQVSGRVSDRGVATLTVSGAKAAHGQLEIRGNRVSGVLAGRRVHGQIQSLAEPARAAVAAVAASIRHRAH
jgi:hypothetical protein